MEPANHVTAAEATNTGKGGTTGRR
jgi:hypothetical protein